MDVANSKESICPECGKPELEDVGWGFKCRSCGYEIQFDTPNQIQFDTPKQIQFDTPKRLLAFIVVHGMPILLYFLFTSVLFIYLIYYTFYLFLDHPCLHDDRMIEVISRLVLFILLSLAVMDLNALIISQYVRRIWVEKHKKIWGRLPVFCMDIPDAGEAIKEDRRYIAKVIAISVVLILMHTFYMILTHPSNVYLSAGECLIGAAAVLIAVGLWKVLDSKYND